jgi:hypothetical protein
MKTKLTGRQAEQAILQKALQSEEAELVAVIGRRRVGKTFLVRAAYAGCIRFEITGIQNGALGEQLYNFADRLNYYARPILPFKAPRSWQDAFQMLIIYLESQGLKEKAVLFFDEFPWLAGRRSDFLKAFGLFWNSWASQNNVLVVICGSAASWMIAHVVRNKGGLHNRITRRIHLQPFTLAETEQYLQSRGVNLDRYQLLQLYMALGGVPHYLKEVEPGKTAMQNIDQICFAPQGLLREEFNQLYPALFEHAETHIAIIRALASTWQGLTRGDIIQHTRLVDGGALTRTLEELASSGFISGYYAFGKKKKGMRYRLTDEYSLFYLKFIEQQRAEGAGAWARTFQTQLWKSWSGYAFESICLKHVPAIKKALGIAGVYTEASAFYLKSDGQHPGLQIDLVIDRQDHAINLFEIKFHSAPFALTRQQADEFLARKLRFQTATGVSKQIFLTLLTTFPLAPGAFTAGVDHALDMNILFEGE